MAKPNVTDPALIYDSHLDRVREATALLTRFVGKHGWKDERRITPELTFSAEVLADELEKIVEAWGLDTE